MTGEEGWGDFSLYTLFTFWILIHMYVLHIQNFLYFKKIGISSRKIQIPGSALDVMNQTPWGQAFLPLNRFPQVILKPRVS